KTALLGISGFTKTVGIGQLAALQGPTNRIRFYPTSPLAPHRFFAVDDLKEQLLFGWNESNGASA
ncbi:MAG TPA: hypothetical protein VGQ52_22400, partial [Gemmatimonadaceae bacterium]|nr:hypothetical protein [Gemmatimonadaceae bacterium]